MGFFDDMFNPGKKYQQAGDVMNQYYNQAQGGLKPYDQMGQQAGNYLQDMMNKFMNPGELESEWSKGYETSPYAQQMMGQAKESGMDAASQMGLMGSSAALNNIQNQAGNIMQQDRQHYMDDLMQKYMQGMGIGQNMYGQGASVASQMGQNAMNMGQNMGGLEYGKHAAGPNFLMQMLGGLGGIGKNWLTGGFGQGSYGRGMFQPNNNYYGGM